MFGVQIALLVALVVLALGRLLLLAKFAVTPTQDILRTPLAFFPNGVAWEQSDAAMPDGLEAGRCGLICFLPDTTEGPEGTPHAFKGMLAEFTVG